MKTIIEITFANGDDWYIMKKPNDEWTFAVAKEDATRFNNQYDALIYLGIISGELAEITMADIDNEIKKIEFKEEE